jgi:N-methylhydantoinase A
VVNAGMERALRVVSVERGFDPRAFTLVSFGGAGGLHAVELARALRMPRVLVPQAPGALSASGARGADVVKDASRTVMLDANDESTRARLERVFGETERAARAALAREGFKTSEQRHERAVTARYSGQSFELEVAWGPSLVERFHLEHEARYGHAQAGRAVEIVSARVRSRGLVGETAAGRAAQDGGRAARARPRRAAVEPHGRARVYFTEKPEDVAVYARAELGEGSRLRTPCVVAEYSSTTLVPAGARCRVDECGNLVIEI